MTIKVKTIFSSCTIIKKILPLIISSFLLVACYPIPLKYNASPATLSKLEYGKRLFEEGYYKRAMKQLLPLACDGNAPAQYAVGYMYYYGYGVAQDTDVGFFWISRAAEKNFIPAINAIKLIKLHLAAVKPHANNKIF